MNSYGASFALKLDEIAKWLVETDFLGSLGTVLSIVLSVVSIALALYSIRKAKETNRETGEILKKILQGNEVSEDLVRQSVNQNKLLVERLSQELAKGNFNDENIESIRKEIEADLPEANEKTRPANSSGHHLQLV